MSPSLDPGADEAVLELLYLLPVGVMQIDRAGDLQLINPRAMQLLQTLAPGQAPTNLFAALEALRPSPRERWAEGPPRRGQPLELPRARVRTADGRECTWSLTLRFVADGQFVAVLEDVTALAAQEEVLAAATKARTEFLANVSHEFRTPMMGVLGLAQLLLGTKVDVEQRAYLELVRSSAESMLSMASQVLDFSKVESGKLTLEHAEFDLLEALSRAVRPLGLRAHEKGVELVYAVAPDVPSLLVGDTVRLRQVLVNLVGNALKFTAAGTVTLEVEVVSRGTDDVVLGFAVTDTGVGIPPEKLELIFEPFVQADESVTRKHGGTGLGLTISRHFVSLMGGTLGVTSEVGRGSRFAFEARFSTPPAAPRVAELATLQGRRVLLLHPHEGIRRALRAWLASWAASVEEVVDAPAAQRALEAARAAGAPFDVVLADGHSAFAGSALLLEAAGGAERVLPLVKAGGGEARLWRELGLERLLLEPVAPEELASALARSQPAPPDEQGAAAGAALRVLVAEDNPVNQLIARRALESAGHRVTIAHDGQQALDCLEREAFDLVLMDVEMPRVDGLEATAAWRKREATRGGHARVFAMTAHASEEVRARCLAAGMDEVVGKPLRLEALRVLLDRG